jgi:hypothetical protein
MSLKYSSLLGTNVDWSDEETSNGKKYLDWDELNLKWENIDMTWDEIFIILEVKRGGSGGYPFKDYIDGNPWNKLRENIGDEKTEKIIKLYCRVNDIDYEKVLEKKEDIKVSTNDFERFINSGANIKIDIKK